jgi:hypothetical protein
MIETLHEAEPLEWRIAESNCTAEESRRAATTPQQNKNEEEAKLEPTFTPEADRRNRERFKRR